MREIFARYIQETMKNATEKQRPQVAKSPAPPPSEQGQGSGVDSRLLAVAFCVVTNLSTSKKPRMTPITIREDGHPRN